MPFAVTAIHPFICSFEVWKEQSPAKFTELFALVEPIVVQCSSRNCSQTHGRSHIITCESATAHDKLESQPQTIISLILFCSMRLKILNHKPTHQLAIIVFQDSAIQLYQSKNILSLNRKLPGNNMT